MSCEAAGRLAAGRGRYLHPIFQQAIHFAVGFDGAEGAAIAGENIDRLLQRFGGQFGVLSLPYVGSILESKCINLSAGQVLTIFPINVSCGV